MYLFLLAALMTPIVVQPQLPSGEAIVKQIAETSETRRSVQYILEGSVVATMAGKPVPPRSGTTQVTVSFAAPGKIRIEEQGLMGNRLQVSDGEFTWVFDPARKQYTKTRAGLRLGTFGTPAANWMGGLPVSEIQGAPKTLRDESIEIDGENHDCWVVAGPLKTSPGVSNAVTTLWIDKTTAIVVRQEVVLSLDPPSAPGRSLDSLDITITMKTRAIKLDEAVPDDRFAFTAPADAKEVEVFSARPEPDRTGRPAASFDVKDLEGKSYTLSALKGKPILLDFWATWCKPCAESAPTLERISKEFKDRLVLLAINVGESRRIVDAYLKPNPMHYPVIMGSDFGIDKAFDVSAFPTFVLIGSDGNIAAQQIGYNGEAGLLKMLSGIGLSSSPTATSSAVDGPGVLEPMRYRPSGVLTDTQGNTYIADSVGAVVRRVSGNGSVERVASDSQLAQPVALAIDALNNLYIADAGNANVRKLTAAGSIEVVSGATQLQRVSGIAVDASANLYIAESGAHRVKRVAPDGTTTIVAGTGSAGSRGDGGPAVAAQLSSPAGLAVDAAGNLYIADTGNRRIRVVTPDGTMKLVAGNGSEGFSGDKGLAVLAQLRNPLAIATDRKGNLYVADSGNFRIRNLSPDGIITTVAGKGTSGNDGDGGPALEARFGSISSLAVDGDGNVYAADVTNGVVRKFSPGGSMQTVAGSTANAR